MCYYWKKQHTCGHLSRIYLANCYPSLINRTLCENIPDADPEKYTKSYFDCFSCISAAAAREKKEKEEREIEEARAKVEQAERDRKIRDEAAKAAEQERQERNRRLHEERLQKEREAEAEQLRLKKIDEERIRREGNPWISQSGAGRRNKGRGRGNISGSMDSMGGPPSMGTGMNDSGMGMDMPLVKRENGGMGRGGGSNIGEVKRGGPSPSMSFGSTKAPRGMHTATANQTNNGSGVVMSMMKRENGGLGKPATKAVDNVPAISILKKDNNHMLPQKPPNTFSQKNVETKKENSGFDTKKQPEPKQDGDTNKADSGIDPGGRAGKWGPGARSRSSTISRAGAPDKKNGFPR